MNFIFVYITNPTRAEARKIAKILLRKKLIACANIFGSTDSLYPWRGKILDEKEYVLIAKTLSKNFKEIKSAVEKIHSYDIPCIVKISVSSNRKFFQWIEKVVK